MAPLRIETKISVRMPRKKSTIQGVLPSRSFTSCLSEVFCWTLGRTRSRVPAKVVRNNATAKAAKRPIVSWKPLASLTTLTE